MKNQLNKNAHINYFKSCLECLPTFAQSQENNRLTMIYFCVSSLDLLDSINILDKESIINYIYSLQIHPKDPNGVGGFRGSPFIGIPFNPFRTCEDIEFPYDQGHIAMIYVALCLLRILGNNYDRINKRAILNLLHKLQQPNGSFCPVLGGSESDMRFVYCASAISYMLSDWSAIDINKMLNYIKSCQSYDGGFGQAPGCESHGGISYCALASLSLSGHLDVINNLQDFIRWCCERQISGFQGRINKDADTCYSFWIGGCLELLNCGHLINSSELEAFIFICQSNSTGGFSKQPGFPPDMLHSYYSLCGLRIAQNIEVLPIDFNLGISKRAVENGPQVSKPQI
eukprot:TRINITY_DN6982_c1_g2_i1.p1 TRINITY_DN6982_c1_g2~~TRINITY_DN6982_c1_g2_i1.p1  ORF type:complete len:354 (-),score=148.24 TRINITY_DN6982_c1_g2_i1:55-1083(-)